MPLFALGVGLLPAAGRALAEEETAPRAIYVAPRAEVRIGNQEAVLVYIDRKLMVFLQRYVDAVPTTGAKIEATADFVPGELKEVAPGVYSGTDWTLAGGRNDIELNYTIDGKTGTVTVPLMISSATGTGTPGMLPAATGRLPKPAIPGYVLGIAALATYLAVMLLFIWRGRRLLQRTV